MKVQAPERRPYRQTARAEAARATVRRILDAVHALAGEAWIEDVTLDAVADRAGVSVQTVLRRFGSREALFAAAVEDGSSRRSRAREEAVAGDVDRAIALLLDEYEEGGEAILTLLAQESRSALAAEVVARGREAHRAWVERVFAPALAELRGSARRRRLAQLAAATDVYTWKLLRRDHGLSRRETERALHELLNPLLED
jgi:AcrR family transcriptional regulator